MNLKLLIICNLMFQYKHIRCTKNSKTEVSITSKTKQHDQSLLEPPDKRNIYEKLYQETRHQNSKNVRLWPALDNKFPNQLVLFAQHLLKCVGKNELVLKADIDCKILTYPIRHYTHQTVTMLRCKFRNNVFRFIEGDENYYGFLVMRTSSANIRFFIAAACLKSTIPDLDFHGLEDPTDSKLKNTTAYQTTELEQCLLDPPQKRLVYEKLYQEGHHLISGKVRLWPALGKKSPDQLAAISNHLAACIGARNHVQYADIEYKTLTYPLRQYKSHTVAMIKCKMGNNVYHFIEGDETYYAFLVLNTPSSNERFFIAAACLKSITSYLEFHSMDLEANTDGSGSKRQSKFQGPSKEQQIHEDNEINMEDENTSVKLLKYQEPLEKLCEYEKMYHSKYSYEDFSKYKSWPLIEKKSSSELFNIAKTFATCFGIELVENVFVREEEKILQYSIKNYKALTVKMLGCHQAGKRSYYFIDGVGDYRSFLVIRMGHCKKQKLFIAAACTKDRVLLEGINEYEDNSNIKPYQKMNQCDNEEGKIKKPHLI